MDLRSAILTDHATARLAKRGIDAARVRAVLATPEHVTPFRPGRVVAQAMIDDNHLMRVFVDVDREPPEVVTVYVTSKLPKYRSRP